MGTGATAPARRARLATRAALALPAVSVALAALQVFGPLAERPVDALRVLGGPTVGATRISMRVELSRAAGGARVPRAGVRFSYRAVAGDLAVESGTGATDDEGAASLAFDVSGAGASALALEIDAGEGWTRAELAAVDAAAAWRGALRRGGRSAVGALGDAELTAAPREGALTVPLRTELVLEVRRAGAPAAGLRLALAAEGATLGAREVLTDERGRASVAFTPLEHGAALVVADAASPERALTYVPPLVPGALHGTLREGRVEVTSPVPRGRAYYAVITDRERIAGGTVALASAPGGTWTGAASVPRSLPAGPAWLVVSSEPDLRSPAVVGWPVGSGDGAPASTTFDAPDLVLADTLPAALGRERARRRTAAIRGAGLATVPLIAAAALLAAAGRARSGPRELARSGPGWVLGPLALLAAAAALAAFLLAR